MPRRTAWLTWTHTREADVTEHFEASRGSVLGSFATPVQLGETPFTLSVSASQNFGGASMSSAGAVGARTLSSFAISG